MAKLKLSLAIGSGRDDLGHGPTVAGDSQRLSSLVNLFNEAKTLGFELRNRDVVHDHYFTYSHKIGQY